MLAVLAVLRGTGSTLGAAFLVGFVADSEAAELAIASRQASKQSFMSDECCGVHGDTWRPMRCSLQQPETTRVLVVNSRDAGRLCFH